VAAFPGSDRLVWNDAEVKRLLDSPQGEIGRDLLRRGLLVEASAKNYATGYGGGPNVRTGRLRSSISTSLGSDEEGLYCDVGSNVEYAGYVELGTRYMRARPFLRPALEAARG
jgi:HK97 gp10 family phage protein